jgi:hypothetical protein
MGVADDRRGYGAARARRLIALGLLLLAASFAAASPARAAFGFQSLSSTFEPSGDPAPASLVAGSHPESWTVTLALNASGPPGGESPDGLLKDLRIELPPGLVGTPDLLPRCSREDYLAESCPAATAVGRLGLEIAGLEPQEAVLYLLEPAPGVAAQLGLHVKKDPITIDLSLDPAPPHGLVAEIVNAPSAFALLGATMTLEGAPGGAPFLTLPRDCFSPLTTLVAATSWQAPQTWVQDPAPEPQGLSDCGSLLYSPELRVDPSTAAAAAPSGLAIDLDAPDPGISTAEGRAAADTRSATLQLPPGMTLNPPVASGLTGCTPGRLAAELPDSDPRTGCPEAAKIGSATVLTPLFDKAIGGDLYLAQPDDPATTAPGAENPFDSLLALYLVIRDADRGVLLPLPIRVAADPVSGRLTARFEQLPELPLSHLSLRFNSGPRAPLTTPAGCGSHRIDYSLTPSSGNPPVSGRETFETTTGCDVAFAPEISVGTASNVAGSAAPFAFDLRNGAGAPNLAGLHLDLPPGLAADFAAVATCPEEAAATAACPPGSRLGSVQIALGAGPEPLWLPSRSGPDAGAYLAGPYGGAPFSLLVSVPATAGPFDLGRVALRAPVRVDPQTSRVSVEISGLPQIRDGIPLHYRALRLVLDRTGFVRNPTSCEPMAIELTAVAASGEVATASDRYQAAGCAKLRFRPRLRVSLSGGLGRNRHPRIDLRLATPRGQANLAAATFELPAGELLDTRRIRRLCAAELPERCPRASRLGQAIVRSPLLRAPLRGPIYLRVPGRRYPDLLADLHGGGVHVLIHGSTGSAGGGRLRLSLAGLPDIPLSQASVTLTGGRHGIVVNSASLCGRTPRASSLLRGHNGRQSALRPRIRLRGRC